MTKKAAPSVTITRHTSLTLAEAIRYAGSEAELLRGVSPTRASNWKAGTTGVPAGHVLKIYERRMTEKLRALEDPDLQLQQALDQVRELYRMKGAPYHRVHDWTVLMALLDLPGAGVRAGRP